MRGRGLGERGCEDRPENGLPLRPSGGWRDGRLGCVSERFRSNKFSTGLRPSYLQPNVRPNCKIWDIGDITWHRVGRAAACGEVGQRGCDWCPAQLQLHAIEQPAPNIRPRPRRNLTRRWGCGRPRQHPEAQTATPSRTRAAAPGEPSKFTMNFLVAKPSRWFPGLKKIFTENPLKRGNPNVANNRERQSAKWVVVASCSAQSGLLKQCGGGTTQHHIHQTLAPAVTSARFEYINLSPHNILKLGGDPLHQTRLTACTCYLPNPQYQTHKSHSPQKLSQIQCAHMEICSAPKPPTAPNAPRAKP